MRNEELYYCYSINLFHFLKQRKFFYLCRGVNEKTQKAFWIFQKSDKLQEALTEYSISKQK